MLVGATGELRQAVSRRRGAGARAAQPPRASWSPPPRPRSPREHELRDGLGAAAKAVSDADAERDDAAGAARAARRDHEEAAEAVRRADWLMERRRKAPDEGPAAVRHAEVAAELRAERRLAEQAERERAERAGRIEWLRDRIERDAAVAALAARAAAALETAHAAVAARRDALSRELQADEAVGERTAAELRSCGQEEAEVQARLRDAGEAVTRAEVRAQQLRDAAAEASAELARDHRQARARARPRARPRRRRSATRRAPSSRRASSGSPAGASSSARSTRSPRTSTTRRSRTSRSSRPSATDLECALAELEGLIKETDKRIRESFEETFEAAAKNFEEMVGHLFPGGRGRLRLVHPDGPRAVGDDEIADGGPPPSGSGEGASGRGGPDEEQPGAAEPGVEIEVTPAGKSTKRLSLMSGGEKSLVALAFLFAVFLARPCPFYILDEVEAALDDANIDRFLQLVRRFSDRAQFIIVTHQKRTMDAADCLYGVSMGGDGVSKVVSRRLPPGAGGVELAPVAGGPSEASPEPRQLAAGAARPGRVRAACPRRARPILPRLWRAPGASSSSPARTPPPPEPEAEERRPASSAGCATTCRSRARRSAPSSRRPCSRPSTTRPGSGSRRR